MLHDKSERDAKNPRKSTINEMTKAEKSGARCFLIEALSVFYESSKYLRLGNTLQELKDTRVQEQYYLAQKFSGN